MPRFQTILLVRVVIFAQFTACFRFEPLALPNDGDGVGEVIGTVDTTAPVVVITSPAMNAQTSVGTAILVTGTASDDVGVTSVSATDDAGRMYAVSGLADWSFTVDTTAIAPGPITFTIVALDAAGNHGQATLTVNVTKVPNVALAQLSGVPASLTNSRSADITVSGANVTQYKYSVDGGALSGATPIATHITLSSLNDGDHTVGVLGGNSDGEFQDPATPTPATWTVDATAPVVTVTPGVTGPTSSTYHVTVADAHPAASFTYVVARAGTGCTNDAPASATFGSDISIDNMVCDGDYTVTFTALDGAGNTASVAPITYSVSHDTTPPTLTVSAAPTGVVTSKTTDFTVAYTSEPGLVTVVDYQVDCDPPGPSGAVDGTVARPSPTARSPSTIVSSPTPATESTR